MIDWLKRQHAFLWIGLGGLVITGIIHLVIYHYTGIHITSRFNFYLVWLIFLILNFIKK